MGTETYDQAVIWTALPQGFVPGSNEQQARVSVFVTPQLSASPGGGTPPHLSTYTDWINWPETMKNSRSGPIKFKVKIVPVNAELHEEGGIEVEVEPDLTELKPQYWTTMFPEEGKSTRVDPFAIENFNGIPIKTFHAAPVHSYVEGLYGPLNAAPATPLNFKPEPGEKEVHLVRGMARPDLYRGVGSIGGIGGIEPGYLMPVETSGAQYEAYSNLTERPQQFYRVLKFHEVAKHERVKPPTEAPVIDFHQAVSSLSAYPELLQYFGLAFTFTVSLAGLPRQTNVPGQGSSHPYFLLSVKPEWTSSAGSNETEVKQSDDVTPRTVGVSATFLPRPYGSDYNNDSSSAGAGFLLLGKKYEGTMPQFAILDIDIDGACQALTTTLAGLETTFEAHRGSRVAVDLRLPSLRSAGPSLLWHGWGEEIPTTPTPVTEGSSLNLAALAWLQTKFQEEVKAWIEANPNSKPPSPLVYSEHLTRGWRLDVGTPPGFIDQAGTPLSWDSLHWRFGKYVFGTTHPEELNEEVPIEGFVSPGVTHQPVENKGDSPAQLWIHESIARWDGWSLSAPRPGRHIMNDGTVSLEDEDTNPVPTHEKEGSINPQVSAKFSIPPAGTVITQPGNQNEELGQTGLPPLRFGNTYFYRARTVDLTGWSLPQFTPSTGVSPEVLAATHYRWEPVRPPFIVPTAALTVGEGALTMVIRDDGGLLLPEPNARWLFPPKVHELLAEEHGAFDEEGVPTLAAEKLIAEYNDGSLTDITGMKNEPGSAGVPNLVLPYNTHEGVPEVQAKWLVDPPAVGLAINGTGAPKQPMALGYDPVPGGLEPFVDLWEGTWPALVAKLLVVKPAHEPYEGFDSVDEKDPTDHWPWLADPVWSFHDGEREKARVLTMTVVPGSVYQLEISSAFAATERADELGELGSFGLWPWIEKATLTSSHFGFGPPPPPPNPAAAKARALGGSQYQLTPAETLTVVYAVLKPQRRPVFSASCAFSRLPNSTAVTIEDKHYVVDPPSTATVTYEATWTDPVDNPAEPEDWAYNPAEPEDNGKVPRAFAQNPRTFSQGGLLLHVENLYPPVVPAGPVTALPPADEKSPFGFIGFEGPFDEIGPKFYAEQRIGDTKHHLVKYTATAASRFGEFFASTILVKLSTTATIIDARGISPNSLKVVVPEVPVGEAPHGRALAAVTVPSSLYEVDGPGGTITLKSGATVKRPPVGEPTELGETVELEKTELAVTFVPTDTVIGPTQERHVLSSTTPPPVKVVKVAPAWSLSRQGATNSGPGYRYDRKGNTLRVYLERPWFATGADELLGVVVAVDAPGSGLPSVIRADLVTTLGLDPISVANLVGDDVSQSQLTFVTNTKVPATETQQELSKSVVNLVEEPYAEDTYEVWPYKPQYDPESGLWFADITLKNSPEAGKPLLPPGYFLRLSLVRYQPFTETSALPFVGSVSPVSLVTFAQPVADRSVEVVGTNKLYVTVRGPGYVGWRGPGEWVDRNNPDAEHPNSNKEGVQTTSTMVVEVQQQLESTFGADFGWSTVDGYTTTLSADISVRAPGQIQNEVEWTSYTPIKLPSSGNPLRLRISEIDYPADEPLPAQINTALRRPFVCHIPLPG